MNYQNRTDYEIFADIICNFENIQFGMMIHIGELIKDPDVAQEIFNQPNVTFSFVENSLKKLVKLKVIDENILKQYDNLFTMSKKAKEYRNEVAHSGFGIDMNEQGKAERKYIVGRNNQELSKETLQKYDSHIMETGKLLFVMLGYGERKVF